ncbi:MAG: tyrosine-type recombinase/integrase, partial [Anaerohalosphaera sp.]|nr:tyrosine-type recombinase/integrase [Anaerohalosphaera sp.]
QFYSAVYSVSGDTKDYFEFIANTGVRATEFCQISWSNISLDKKTLTVFGKGQKYRTIPLNETCLKIIARYKDNEPTIFLSKNVSTLSRHGLHKRCVAASKKAKIEQFGPHALRHYFATRLLLKGVNMKIVSMLLGHTSVKTTEKVYIHIMPDDLNGVTDIIG